MSNFTFLAADFPALYDAATCAEELAAHDKGAQRNLAVISAGRAMEIAVKWAFAHDAGLTLPYQDSISTLIHDPTFRRQAGEKVFEKLKYINRIRNRAAHEDKPVLPPEAQGVVQELFHVLYWFGRSYGRKQKPGPGARFDTQVFAGKTELMRAAAERIKQQEQALAERDRALADLRSGKASADAEVVQLRQEVAATRAAASAAPDPHDYNEAETRDRFIDLLLREAGWTEFRPGREVEYRVTPMPNDKNEGFVDYVLWGADGKPLGLVEAKRTRFDARKGQQQAKLYADALEQMHGQRPVIFYTNGYEHWIWDDAGGRPPRRLGGFYKREELELAVARRQTARPLASITPDGSIIERPYQFKAIGRVAEDFDGGRHKALLVMATGTGKTRTVIALADAMMRANRVKRVLFLADRVSLVRQAVNAFKRHLPASNPVNLVSERHGQGRVYVSTYPTMMGLIDGAREKGADARHFGAGHFDLIIIDEAHRSVYRRYQAIFEYFDSYLVGLTATPRDEVDRDTYSLFDLEPGVPTDSYDLDQAIAEGYLVPPEPLSVPTKFTRGGIRYDELSDEEKDRWDMLEWDEGVVPDEVSVEALNKFLFNQDTVDKVLGHVMQNGIRTEGGDRLGKTIVFAKNQKHAEYIEERFNANWPHLKGHFARVITYKGDYAQSLIDDFSQKDKAPHLAISVDMLDTGIDVPEVVNLVFFKLVRSKTKFWQMVGRGTRLCEDLFGPGQHKAAFRIFDFCQNLEYFGQDPATKDAPVGKSLGERLFAARVALVRQLRDSADDLATKDLPRGEYDAGRYAAPPIDQISADALNLLKQTVASMSLDNFVVRTQRALVEKYQDEAGWDRLDEQAAEELEAIAGLPNGLEREGEEARRFDLLMLSLQLALLKASKRFESLKQDLIEIAGLLEQKPDVPAIKANLVLLEEIQTEQWWEGITVPLLELVRRRLREIVRLIDRKQKTVLYSNFEDELGEATTVPLPNASPIDEVSFRRKAQAFLRQHQDHVALRRVRSGKPLTPADLAELEQMLIDAGVGTPEDFEQAASVSNGFANFIRSLVGLDRAAATAAFEGFLSEDASPDQIEFIQLIIQYLTQNGVMDPGAIYESPFTDRAPAGPEAVFGANRVVELTSIVRKVGCVDDGASASNG